jgi:hypothetical protein
MSELEQALKALEVPRAEGHKGGQREPPKAVPAGMGRAQRGTGSPAPPGIGDKAGQATFVEEAPTPAQSRVAFACVRVRGGTITSPSSSSNSAPVDYTPRQPRGVREPWRKSR